MKTLAQVMCLLVAGAVSVWTSSGAAPVSPPPGETWRYQLLQGSTYLDDCLPCGRPALLRPLHGSFFLAPGAADPLFNHYELRQVQFQVGGDGPDAIHLEGTGELAIGGEVLVGHRLTFHLTVTSSAKSEIVDFDSGLQPGEPAWPWLAIPVTEVNASLFRILNLTLDAMPIRDLWFSTGAGFTAAQPGPTPVAVSPADVLSDQGHIAVPAAQIEAALQLVPITEPRNLDAVGVAPGGVVEVSLAADATSAILDTVHHGDLVSLAGIRVKSWSDFAGIIGPQPPSPDLGLDAVQDTGDGTLLFSTRDAIFSETLGEVIGRGDLMTSSGQRLRTNAELLKAFHPSQPDHDYGLDAVFLWPGGEIWFSTEEPVPLEGGVILSDGDLLSDTGRVIYGNLELLQRFAPIEDRTSFGLDALVIATDATNPADPPRITSIRFDPATSGLALTWTGDGRFFQVERAGQLDGAFAAAGPVVAGLTQTLPATDASSFFRIRQW
jgi:hypothetical protein